VPSNIPLSQQIFLLQRHLELHADSTMSDPNFSTITEWVRQVPPAARSASLTELLCRKFHITEEALTHLLNTTNHRSDFDSLVPRNGYFRDYIEFTRTTEPPTVFHFFVAATTLGTTLARNVRFNKGSYFVFPNLCCVLVAPSGRCRKTSACNIGVSLYRSIGGTILADKTTPEALVEAFRDATSAVGLLYAPELAVFLGKQKYQEGMVPLLTSLFDCPTEWSSKTIGRGDAQLHNVALSLLAASTMDWIQTGIPRDAFGGGFMSRLLFVIQNDTPRSFPLPPPMDETLRAQLLTLLREAQDYRGEFTMNPAGRIWYEDWYNERADNRVDERHFAGYYERKPDQLIRVAMLLAAASGHDQTLTPELLQHGLNILDHLELSLPAAFDSMAQNAVGEDTSRLLKQLRNRGGQLDHSTWLRLNSSRMNARLFREAVDTLRLAGFVEQDVKTHLYYLTPEGWNH